VQGWYCRVLAALAGLAAWRHSPPTYPTSTAAPLPCPYLQAVGNCSVQSIPNAVVTHVTQLWDGALACSPEAGVKPEVPHTPLQHGIHFSPAAGCSHKQQCRRLAAVFMLGNDPYGKEEGFQANTSFNVSPPPSSALFHTDLGGSH
jgi:hypothetical protein